VSLLIRRPALITAVGSGLWEYVPIIQVGLHPIETHLPMPYHVSVDMSKNAAIERTNCEECEEADDHGGGTSR